MEGLKSTELITGRRIKINTNEALTQLLPQRKPEIATTGLLFLFFFYFSLGK